MGKSLGPNGLKCLLQSDSGKLLVTSQGAAIINSLQFTHPLGKMLQSCVSAHHRAFGDGSKTMVLLLRWVINWIHATDASGTSSRCELVQNLDKFHDFMTENLLNKIIKHPEVTRNNLDDYQNNLNRIITTFLGGYFSGMEIRHLTEVICDIVKAHDFQANSSISVEQQKSVFVDYTAQFMNRCIECPGALIQATHIASGMIIQRSVVWETPNIFRKTPLKFVLLGSNTEEDTEEDQSVLTVNDPAVLTLSFMHRKRRVEQFMVSVKKEKVDLILVQQKADNHLVDACRLTGVALIHFVPEEDIRYLTLRCGVSVVYDWTESFGGCSCVGMLGGCTEVIVNGRPCLKLEKFVPVQDLETKMKNCDVIYDSVVKSRPEQDDSKTMQNCDDSEPKAKELGEICANISEDRSSLIDKIGQNTGSNNCVMNESRRSLRFETLIVCGPSAGVCHQVTSAMRCAFKLVSSWLFDSLHLPHQLQRASSGSLTTLSGSQTNSSGSHTALSGSETGLSGSRPGSSGSENSAHRSRLTKLESQAKSPGAQVSPDRDKTPFGSARSDAQAVGQSPAALCITGGGAFELKLARLIEDSVKARPVETGGMQPWCGVFVDALRSIPAQLLSNSYASQHKRLNAYFLDGRAAAEGIDIYGVDAVSGERLISRCDVLEPLLSKTHLVVDVLTFLRTLLRLEHYVHVRVLPGKVKVESDDDDSD